MSKDNNDKNRISLSDEQKKIVFADTRNNMLVSASAGAGKTHVLVERIKELLVNEKYDINLSDILIMTFTVAATTEMKVRIKKAIEKTLEEEKFSEKKKEQLIKELALIQNANISTIDSFCKKILMENYHYLNNDNSIYGEFDPGYRIADEKELQILYDSVLDEFLEKKYSDKKYNKIYDIYFIKTDDSLLRRMLLDGLLHISKFAWPVEWIKEQIESYEKNSDKAFYEYINIKIEELFNYINNLENIKEIFDKYIKILENANIKAENQKKKGFSDYITVLIQIRDVLVRYSSFSHNKQNHDLLIDEVNNIWSFKSFPKNIKPFLDISELEYEKLKNKLKDIIDSIKNAYKIDKFEIIDNKVKYNEIEKLFLELLLEFFKKVVDEKRRKNIYAISDYAVLALNILYDVKDGKRVISKRAYDIGNKYKLIFVDEYQDTNRIQEKLLEALTTDKNGNIKNNLFLVGDMKQSIYAFRNAEPKLFKEKEKSELFNKYYLEENYRSKKCVLDFVNTIFENIMYEKFGDIDYKINNRLTLPTIFENNNEYIGPKVEVDAILGKDKISEENNEINEEGEIDITFNENADGINNDDEVKRNGNEYEAIFIANKIEELVKEGYEYKNIMILARTYSKFPLIIDALNSKGIPCYGKQKKGFYGREEINLIIDILKIIDNPLQDIPLVNILTSDIFSVTENEIAYIKLLQYTKDTNNKYSLYLYDAIVDFINMDKDLVGINKYQIDYDELKDKLNRFVDLFKEFTFKARYLSISELISLIYEKTYIKDIMTTHSDGNLRIANLNIFYENANGYESTSYVGLFNFIRYIEKINNNTLDQELANVLAEDDNVVNMTTIHQSKGLQYKVVILCGCHTNYTEKGLSNNAKYIYDNDYGISLNVYNQNKNVFLNTPKRKVIIQNKLYDSKKEEIRLLYVALTRAVEKLILTGFVASKGGKGFSKNEISENATKISDVINAKNYFNLVIPNIRHEETDSYIYNEIEAGTLDKFFIDNKNNKKKYKIFSFNNDTLSDKFKSDLYKFKDLQLIAPKVSVSTIKESLIEVNKIKDVKAIFDDSYYKNEDLNENLIKTISSSDKGNAYHRYMQFLDFTTGEYLNIKEKKYENYQFIDKIKIKLLLESNVGKLMTKAYTDKKLFREHKFMHLFSQNDVNKYKKTDTKEGICYNIKNVVIQGIIDAFFINDDNTITLIDYKTDMIDSKYDKKWIRSKLIENYQIQLDIYSDVIKSLTGLIVKDKYIYSFAIDEWISV